MPGPTGVAGSCGIAFPVIAFPKQQDPMNMVRHDHKRIELHLGEMSWNFFPAARHGLSRKVTLHYPVQDLTEETRVAARANGDKVHAGLSVVVPRKPQPPPLRLFRFTERGRAPKHTDRFCPGLVSLMGLLVPTLFQGAAGRALPGPYGACHSKQPIAPRRGRPRLATRRRSLS